MPRAAAASAVAVAVPGRAEVRLRDARTRAGRLAASADAKAAMFVLGIRGWRFDPYPGAAHTVERSEWAQCLGASGDRTNFCPQYQARNKWENGTSGHHLGVGLEFPTRS